MGLGDHSQSELLAEVERLREEVTALREEQARLLDRAKAPDTELMDNAPIMILLIDKDGRVWRANGAARRAFELTDEADGCSVGSFFGCVNARKEDSGYGPSCEGCPLRRILQATLETGLGVTGEEVELILGREATGTSFLASTSCLHYEGRNLAMLCLEDVTEKRRDEVLARKTEEKLRQSQQAEAVGRLAGGVAHDFNNLLTAIIGHARLAMEGMSPEEPVWTRLDGIYWAGKRAAALTGQLLAFSSRQMLQKTVRDLNEMVRDQAEMLGRLLGETSSVTLELDENLPPVELDASHMAQVLLNLIVNAREAMPEGGEVTLVTKLLTVSKRARSTMPDSRPGQFIRLTVKDTGTGMSSETVPKIFEPFFSTKKGGTGMGLPMVQGLIRQHGGWIFVDSKPGRGSSIHLYLPVSDSEVLSEPMEDTGQHLDEVNGSGWRILVVEDEESLLELATVILSDKGFEVFSAATATIAETLFDQEQGRFDLVFSDVVLPDGNGVDLTQGFLRARPDLPVLLTSGYADHRSRWHVIQERRLEFMRKPYTPSELLQRVRSLLRAEM